MCPPDSYSMEEQAWPLLSSLQGSFCFHEGASEARPKFSFPHPKRSSLSHTILRHHRHHPYVLSFIIRPLSPSLSLTFTPLTSYLFSQGPWRIGSHNLIEATSILWTLNSTRTHPKNWPLGFHYQQSSPLI